MIVFDLEIGVARGTERRLPREDDPGRIDQGVIRALYDRPRQAVLFRVTVSAAEAGPTKPLLKRSRHIPR